jgi:hypothetical protein
MRRHVITLIALCVLGMVAGSVALLVGCQSKSATQDWIKTGVPEDVVYAGNRYMYAGYAGKHAGIVASQDTDASPPSNVMYIGSTSYEFGEYDVYLIQCLDENEAIALKMGRVGGYTYLKYERLYGQEEPADFVYEGSNYGETGEIIAIQSASESVAVGEPESVSYLSSVVYQGTTYDVYSIHIQGEDRSHAIAVKIAKAGKTVGFYCYYFTYERQ